MAGLQHCESEDGEFDAAEIDWCSGIRLREVNRNWRFSQFQSCAVVREWGQPGLERVCRSPEAYAEYAISTSRQRGLRKHHRRMGSGKWMLRPEADRDSKRIARGWGAFTADFAIDDALVRDTFPALSFPTTVQICFEGGVPHLQAPILVSRFRRSGVIGASPSAMLFCNGKSVGACSQFGSPGFLQIR